MKIGIFGMGYVGTTSAACLMCDGHEIIGVDIDKNKIDNLSVGKTPMVYEEGIEKLLREGYLKGLLKATVNTEEGVVGCDMIWICVGTPSKFDGDIDLSCVKDVIKSICSVLKNIKNYPCIVIRSTCLPGTTENIIKPLIEKESGLIVGRDIKLLFHPEFLREGTAISDFKNPPKIVVGECNSGDSDILLDLYKSYTSSCFKLNFTESEMVKYYDNIFHALKITFSNEMASLCRYLKIDPSVITKVFCADTKLNISTAYLNPGFVFGGSCLPKDLRAIIRFASLNYLQIPMIEGILDSNSKQITNLINKVLFYNPSKVGIAGISFKSGTNDLRESPYVEIAKILIGEGINIKIYDPMICQDDLIGSNKKQFYRSFRNISNLMVSSLDDLTDRDLILINHHIVEDKYIKIWTDEGIEIINLVNNS